MNNRTLYRPMFRRGGKVDSRGTGITTGLMPRKNFAVGGISDEDANFDFSQQGPNINTTLGVNSDYDSISELMSTKQDLRDEFGLNYEIPEPEKGLSMSDYVNIFGTGADILLTQDRDTVGQKVKDTAGDIASSIQTRKIKEQQDREKAFGVKSGEFDTAYTGVQGDIEAAEAQQNALELLREEYNLKSKTPSDLDIAYRIQILDKKLADGDINEDQYKKETLNLITKADTLDFDKYAVELALSDPNIVKNISELVMKQLNDVMEKTDPDYEGEYRKRLLEAIVGYITDVKRDLDLKKDGGRVGKANGGSMNQQTSTQIPTTSQQQIPTTSQQETPTGLTFDEVRARLPQEISNDVVYLIVQVPQALADFSEIQTQNDVTSFNQKYSVNLTIPQQGV